ncbi:ATP-binding cassette domain-containing protein [Bacillus sp. Marseille-P3800]|uniref:ATP-binding cassette domain-containing protein n=1 Tax=Bacillus sp. Marseille-P3800 TaxID=2014782 RepID=UPI000C076010|nr:ABC transporter ATP-binding protein [Bacillus sp. Marseille-P3800]
MLTLQDVSFQYEDTYILNELNLHKEKNEIIALWGRNSVGKTTLMKLLAGQEKPTNGRLTIDNVEPFENDQTIRKICYVQEDHPFNGIWTLKELLIIGEEFYPNWRSDTAEHLIKQFDLPYNKKISSFSKGMKTATQIMMGLSSHAEITIFDEPNNGLDAGARRLFYQLLQENHEEFPRMIFVSTHHIEEIHPISDSLLVIHQGQVLIDEEMDKARERGVLLSGEKEAIETMTANCSLYDQRMLGSKMKVMADLAYNSSTMKKAEDLDITIEPTEVQEYLLNLTDVNRPLEVS